MTLEEFVSDLESEVTRLAAQRKAAHDKAAAIVAAVEAEQRSATADEDAEVDSLFAVRSAKAEALRAAEAKLAKAKEELAAERATSAALKTTEPTQVRGYNEVARVGQEKRTYNPDNDKRGHGFLIDLGRATAYRDPIAQERIDSHMREESVERSKWLEKRAAGTGSFPGLVVPQYLTDFYAPNAKAMRPFADAMHKIDLPAQGTSVNIARITGPTDVELQSSENSAVQDATLSDTLLTVNVQTAAGQSTLSRQALDRGTGIEGILLDDLFRAHGTKIDNVVINQATTGLSAVANSTTVATGVTGPQLYSKILGAIAGVEQALLGLGKADAVVMSPARWAWLQAQSTSSWPLIQQPAYDPRVFGDANGVGYDHGFRGTLPNGTPVIVDQNVPQNLGGGTNQDEIYVVPLAECILWEDPDAPVFIRADQPAANALGVLYVLYSYFAYTFGRYTNAMQKLSGAGLTTPSF